MFTTICARAKPPRIADGNAALTPGALAWAMAYDPGAIDASLAAALGEDAALIAELRAAFVESAVRASAGLQAAEDAASWRSAALRLKGLAASFGAVRLMAIAAEAAEAVPHDPRVADRVARAVARL